MWWLEKLRKILAGLKAHRSSHNAAHELMVHRNEELWDAGLVAGASEVRYQAAVYLLSSSSKSSSRIVHGPSYHIRFCKTKYCTTRLGVPSPAMRSPFFE